MADKRRVVTMYKLVSGEEIIAMQIAHEAVEKHDGSSLPCYVVQRPVMADTGKRWIHTMSDHDFLHVGFPIPCRLVMLLSPLTETVFEEQYLDRVWGESK